MGNFFSKLFDRLRGFREARLLILGLDNAGKTTILYKLKFNQTVTTVPTAGFNVECLIHRNIKFHVWDVGGQDKIRPLWRHYHTGTRALIFVVDSQDSDRIHEARTELHRILSARELSKTSVLVYANKQDLPHAMTCEQVRNALQLDRFANRGVGVFGTCATSGDGLIEGLNWLADNINEIAVARSSSSPVSPSVSFSSPTSLESPNNMSSSHEEVDANFEIRHRPISHLDQ